MRIWIALSGPIANLPPHNAKVRFNEAAHRLDLAARRIDDAVHIWNPTTIPPDTPYAVALRDCLQQLICAEASRQRDEIDACWIVTLEGWRESNGARAEVAAARWYGWPVLPLDHAIEHILAGVQPR